MAKTTRIFGPPGTGKTTTLIGIVEKCLLRGVPPERIAYVSFSKKAATEAVDRATKRFGFPKSRFPYFATLHSLGYKALGMQPGEKMEPSDFQSIAELLGIRVSEYIDEEDTVYGTELGDHCIQIHNLARAKMITPEQQWKEAENKININYSVVQQWIATVDEYKQRKGMYDFTDMLVHYTGALPVDIFIVDEAQDLSKLQWLVVRQASAVASEIYIAGDDDQCIYGWNGADLHSFLNFPVDEDIVLPQSYRVPSMVAKLSNSIVNEIETRKPKEWLPRDEKGNIYFEEALDSLPLETGEWMLLTRNSRFLKDYENHLKDKGLLYKRTRGKPLSIDTEDAAAIIGWEKLKKGELLNANLTNSILKRIDSRAKRLTGNNGMKQLPIAEHLKTKQWYEVFSRGMHPNYVEYIRSCLRNGQKLQDKPRITVSTIHKMKGGECENVVIMPDMSYATYQEAHNDEEHRIWYVGVTRTLQNLYLLAPATDLFYRF